MEQQSSTKRKQPPSSNATDRPSKQLRRPSQQMDEALADSHKPHTNGFAVSAPDTKGHSSPQQSVDEEGGSIIVAAADTAEWQATIEKVVSRVVSIHFCQTCAFDTDSAISSEATGFVVHVDESTAYILTNRHVVGSGPFWGYAIFDNHEECDVYPVYRDPVHDFGLLRFNPSKIKYMALAPLDLRPDLAKVGVEIRVVGNDAGEKLSILSGVISRLDRNAPEYGEGYSDFNTNYIQAAAAASGGSSGSPVVNIDGHAVALQAGGRSDGAATDYFLPLDRPLRALQCVRKGEPVSRGTIQTQWVLKAFDECRRLGLDAEWESKVRAAFPKETGIVDNKPTPDLDTFVDVMKSVPDRSRVVVTYKHLRDMHTLNTSIMLVDRHWHKHMRQAVRNDVTGVWDFTDLSEPVPPTTPVPRKANFVQMAGAQHPQAVDIIRSFVRISASMPLKLDGFPKSRKIGFGLVIDAEKGLVVVSRAIVPYEMCDISVTIADSIIVDGKVVFMHPLQNYAVVRYDPSLVQAPVKSAKLADRPIKQGEQTIFFGFNQNLRPVVAKTAVTDITTVAIPASASTPRYRAVNLDAITVDTSLSGQCGSGVLVTEDGTVQALWMTYLGERNGHSGKDVEYHLGFGTPALLPVIEEIKGGGRPDLRILNLETQTVQMSQCRIMGVSEEWIERVEREDPERHQLFMVRKVDAGNTGGLQEGDVVLTLNDKLITRVSHMDVMYTHDTLRAVVVRKQQEVELDIPTVPTSELETDRVVVFCGAVLHRPHHAVRQQISKVHSDIYVSARMGGSPAYMYGLAPTNFILAVNAVPTPDIESFLREVMTFDNVPWVATMKKNEHYFPTVEFIKDGSVREGWRRVTYEDGKVRKGEGECLPNAADEGGATGADEGMEG
ncbi:hypothetical protein LTR48_002818 [Friedmanniomyces endolithicus]|uniref:Pro-apoptotic serine protease NMA111 n=1 Tax=Rachicladosporium monterosium TaxID=1507873 RepID=A0ABR0LA00_9PEZI|nr:hypothetical protein LTR48_002818 [Friedmanniomyces endolithicus]KAK5145778.1 hypothetical protein LTR32_002524 [Rachicladosporium monterosium]